MWSMGALLMVNAVACFALLMGRCTPFEAVYDVTFPPSKATCFSPWVLVAIAVYTTVCCAAADLYLAIYPSIVLSKLQINKKKKIALSIALGIGSMYVFNSPPPLFFFSIIISVTFVEGVLVPNGRTDSLVSDPSLSQHTRPHG